MARGEIQLIDLRKDFGELTAVDEINLRMPGGEFFSLLGPSGCGKTTTLRMIAGFERPSSGRILLDGSDVAYTPPHKRNVNTVFQNYALFPHLNVYDNIAFGLRRARRPKDEVRQRVARALELVQLSGLEKRKSSQLSGGQQQRVALARALVLNPAVLLLDEPLGALDAKLRKALQLELKVLQQEVGVTFLYVTHDQEEALTMSDRLAVMNAGRIEQVGAPRDVYEDPQTLFVADFLGVSNLMDATVVSAEDGRCRVSVDGFELETRGVDGKVAGSAKIVIRPERVELEPHGAASGPNRLPAMVERIVYVGSAVKVIIRAATGEMLEALVQNTGTELPYVQGTPVQLHLPAEALRLLPDQGLGTASDEVTAPDEEAAATA
ncbi:MAG: ABC transporter ATP-binding protein [Actinobacteria bacterium]|nr:MAG: ABC transporter ATP-binding protein [Actinomycetota bacterium]